MTRERLEEIVRWGTITDDDINELIALARRGLEAEEEPLMLVKAVTDLRRACELAQEYRRAVINVAHTNDIRVRNRGIDLQQQLDAALAAVGLPVEE